MAQSNTSFRFPTSIDAIRAADAEYAYFEDIDPRVAPGTSEFDEHLSLNVRHFLDEIAAEAGSSVTVSPSFTYDSDGRATATGLDIHLRVRPVGPSRVCRILSATIPFDSLAPAESVTGEQAVLHAVIAAAGQANRFLDEFGPTGRTYTHQPQTGVVA